MSVQIFERIFKSYIESVDTETTAYLKMCFSKSQRSTYYGFLDDFLFKRGLISFALANCEDTEKFIPYFSFNSENIFNKKAGFEDLSKKPLTSNKCYELLAEELIQLLRTTNIERLKLE